MKNSYIIGKRSIAKGSDGGEISSGMLKAVYDVNDNGIVDRAENADKVNGFTVGKSVPANAIFTDTTYSEITEAEIDAGAASTSRAISSRRIKYILDKVQSWIGSLTKNDVGLGNVNNTSDANKPISSAAQTALDGKVDNSKVLTNVPAGAKFTDTIYTHPASHPASMITNLPTSLPANGGNADTVGGFTVGVSVPANAKFTDTVYSHPTAAGNKHIPTGGASGQVLKYSASGTATWQADSDTITTINGKTGAISKADIVTLGIPAQDTVYSHPPTHSADIIIDGVSNKTYTATEKKKLADVATNANNYTHPVSHPSSIIEQDASNRFVTDIEKANWNGKQDSLGYIPLNANLKGSAGGVAELDSNGRVPSSQLPSYVDDVLEHANISLFPTIGESGKIYITSDTNLTYRWSGAGYVEISPSIALGETSATAYRGDRGKTAYEHSQTVHNKSLVGLGNVDNTSDANKPISTATQSALNTKLDSLSYAASDVLTKIKTVDGNGSGLDADLLDGQHANSFAPVSHNHTTSNVSGLADVASSGDYDDLLNKPSIPELSDDIIVRANDNSAPSGSAEIDANLLDGYDSSFFVNVCADATEPVSQRNNDIWLRIV